MRTELVTATHADRERLNNLLQLYLHDFSELFGFPPDDDGRYAYPGLDAYWNEPGRFPFLIRAAGQLAGFALVSRGSQVSGDATVFDVSEFFVVRSLRRQGVASAAAKQVFSSFPGTWEVRVMERNTGAVVFWQRAVAAFTAEDFESVTWISPRGTTFRVFRFTNPPYAAA